MPDTDNHLLSKLEKKLFDKPFGSLTKRELEITLLEFLMEHGEEMSPEELAAKARLTMTKANSYLVDIALRKSPDTFNDEAMQKALLTLATESEVLAEGDWFRLNVKDVNLRIWLERKLSELNRINGERLSPGTLSVTKATFVQLVGWGILTTGKITSDQRKEFAKKFKNEDWWEAANAKLQKEDGISLLELADAINIPLKAIEKIDKILHYGGKAVAFFQNFIPDSL